jgi:hypothetical protein
VVVSHRVLSRLSNPFSQRPIPSLPPQSARTMATPMFCMPLDASLDAPRFTLDLLGVAVFFAEVEELSFRASLSDAQMIEWACYYVARESRYWWNILPCLSPAQVATATFHEFKHDIINYYPHLREDSCCTPRVLVDVRLRNLGSRAQDGDFIDLCKFLRARSQAAIENRRRAPLWSPPGLSAPGGADLNIPWRDPPHSDQRSHLPLSRTSPSLPRVFLDLKRYELKSEPEVEPTATSIPLKVNQEPLSTSTSHEETACEVPRPIESVRDFRDPHNFRDSVEADSPQEQVSSPTPASTCDEISPPSSSRRPPLQHSTPNIFAQGLRPRLPHQRSLPCLVPTMPLTSVEDVQSSSEPVVIGLAVREPLEVLRDLRQSVEDTMLSRTVETSPIEHEPLDQPLLEFDQERELELQSEPAMSPHPHESSRISNRDVPVATSPILNVVSSEESDTLPRSSSLFLSLPSPISVISMLSLFSFLPCLILSSQHVVRTPPSYPLLVPVPSPAALHSIESDQDSSPLEDNAPDSQQGSIASSNPLLRTDASELYKEENKPLDCTHVGSWPLVHPFVLPPESESVGVIFREAAPDESVDSGLSSPGPIESVVCWPYEDLGISTIHCSHLRRGSLC